MVDDTELDAETQENVNLDILSKMSGLTKETIRKDWRTAVDNKKALMQCPQHKWLRSSMKLLNTSPFHGGQKKTIACLNCKGEAQLGYVTSYSQGFKAAGGTESDLWDER